MKIEKLAENKFIKKYVKENEFDAYVCLYGENKNCDGKCKKVNTCPIINDGCI